ncbi:MAG: LPS assembly lipoprotein LptE [Alphaproteobacteria bacterium]
MSWSRIILAAAAALWLAACGFEPLNAPRGGTTVPAAMQTVQIANIPDRAGQYLRNWLRDEINPYGVPGAPRYRLDILLAERRDDIGLRRDDVRTRTNLTLEAEYRLVALADGKIVLQGKSRTVSSFNLLVNDYSNVVGEKDAREQALREIGGDIRTRLSLYFRRLETAGG